MNISILETGKLPGTLEKQFGDYTSMFSNLFKEINLPHKLRTYEVTKFQLPNDPKDSDLWLITGSSFGVYDNLAWISDIKDLIKQITEEKVPLLGVCFGHQILAEAMGGKVEKSMKGWGIGIHKYDRLTSTMWSEKLGKNFSGYASHQDQVTIIPKDSTSVYGSKFCPHSVLSYGDKEKPNAISIQSHPEFSKDCLRAIISRRIGKTIPKSVGKRALESLNVAPDNLKVFRSLLEAIQVI